jgi:hypothetical protein
MAVTLTDGSAGLFDVFGRMFQAMASMQTSAGTTVRTDCLDILTQFGNVDDSLALNAIIADVTTVADTFDSGAQSAMQSLKTIAQGYLLTVFHEDAPFANPSVDNALLRLIAQMEADSDSVDASTVSIAVAAGGSNVGNAVLVATVKRGDGLDQMHVLAEVLTATALTDEGATLSLSDGESVGVTSVRWPQGSGASQSLRAVTPRDGLIREGSFDVLSTVDSDLPAGWLVTTGTPGTTLYMTTPEQQTITLGNTPSGGYYSLRWTNAAGDVQETAQLTYNATAGQVQSALRRLTGLESVTVTSSGTTPNLTHTVTFLGIGGNVAQVSSRNNTTGDNTTNEIQTITISDADGGTFTLTFGGQTTSSIAWNAAASVVDTALEALSTIEVGEVSVSGSAGGPYTVTFTNSLGASDQSLMTASAASLTHTSPGVSIVETTAGAGAGSSLPEPLAYWDMEEAAGESRIDEVGGIALTLNSGDVPIDTGIAGNAIEFDDDDNYLKTAYVSGLALNPGDSYTLAAWVRINGDGDESAGISLMLQSSSNYFQVDQSLSSDPYTIRASAGNGTTAATKTVSSIAYGTGWRLLIAVVDPANDLLKLSVDGAAFVTAAMTFDFVSDSTWRCIVSGDEGQRVDEVAIWNAAFDDDDATALWNSGAGTFYPFASTDEVQTVTLTNTPTGGTFTLTYDSQETSAIAYNASASAVEAALEALSTIDSCSVSGSAGGPWAVTFQGSLAATDIDLMTGDGGNLTNASPSISIVETAKGSSGGGTITHATTIPGTPQVYSGSYALVLESDGSEQTTLHYRLGTLEAETNYAVNAFLTAAAGIASGTLTIDLLDGIDGTVLTDEQGANQTLTVTLTDLTTSWQSLDDLMTEVVLRTPRKLPPFVYLRIRWGTVPPDGATVFIDELTMVSMTELYAGGPFVVMFAGNTALRIDDVYTLTVANNRAGTLHEWMNRTFDLADKRLLLPVDAAGSETIPDSLIQ